ncbi:MAG: hypothetical protein WKF97_26525 [Chitinophagaceae bacterium]
MLQVNNATKELAMVGEEISHELGAKMIKDFQDANPNDKTGNYIGRSILESILAQPDCMGICFYNAINEMGEKTLVYVGVDGNEKVITEYVGINAAGKLVKQKGIVADRGGKPPSNDDEKSWWEWLFDII